MVPRVRVCEYDPHSGDHRYDHEYSDIRARSLVIESCSSDRCRDEQRNKDHPPGRISPSTHGHYVPRVHSWMDTVGDALHC